MQNVSFSQKKVGNATFSGYRKSMSVKKSSGLPSESRLGGQVNLLGKPQLDMRTTIINQSSLAESISKSFLTVLQTKNKHNNGAHVKIENEP